MGTRTNDETGGITAIDSTDNVPGVTTEAIGMSLCILVSDVQKSIFGYLPTTAHYREQERMLAPDLDLVARFSCSSQSALVAVVVARMVIKV